MCKFTVGITPQFWSVSYDFTATTSATASALVSQLSSFSSDPAASEAMERPCKISKPSDDAVDVVGTDDLR